MPLEQLDDNQSKFDYEIGERDKRMDDAVDAGLEFAYQFGRKNGADPETVFRCLSEFVVAEKNGISTEEDDRLMELSKDLSTKYGVGGSMRPSTSHTPIKTKFFLYDNGPEVTLYLTSGDLGVDIDFSKDSGDSFTKGLTGELQDPGLIYQVGQRIHERIPEYFESKVKEEN